MNGICSECEAAGVRDGVCDHCIGSGRAEAMERGAPLPAQRNDVAKWVSPGWWQPEVQVTDGGPWTTKIPDGFGRPWTRKDPSAPQGYRVFGLSHDDERNLEPFRIFYVDDKHAGMGPLYESHGLWSLDFFPPDGNGIAVNDDEESIHGRPYRLRFRKTSDSLSADAR